MAKRERATWELDAGAADTARLLMLLAQAQHQHLLQQQHAHAHAHHHHHGHGHGAGVPFPVVGHQHHGAAAHGRVFECKTCSRQFPTFQALGGHRASHKRPRVLQQPQQQPVVAESDHAGLCLGRQPLQLPTLPTPTTTQQAAKPRVHECPVCGLEFAIGQALGGHMRRHRAEAEADAAAAEAAAPPSKLLRPPLASAAHDNNKAAAACCDVAGGVCLDLNLTPSENCAKCRSVVVLGGAAAAERQQQGGGVHNKTLAMLDCSL